MALRRVMILALLVALAASGCASPGSSGASRTGNEARPANAPNPSAEKTVRVAVRYEIDNLATKVLGPNSPTITRRFFNASQALIDDKGVARPYLAETLPQLNTDTWKVFPDGRMETTYTLRPNLTWHDGQPLTAEDFVFAYWLYKAPSLGYFSPDPQDAVDDVVALDDRTVIIHWNSLFFDAGSLREDYLDPLPKHILERPFTTFVQDPSAREAFLNLPFWTQEYIGAGPYKLTQWVPGAQLEGVAFDGHALGKPKIGRIILRLFNDENTTLTNLLSSNLDITVPFALRYEHGEVLRNDWEPRGSGKVLSIPGSNSASVVQFRPEYQKTRGLLDLRVRRAIAHAIDKNAVNEGVFDGRGYPVDTFMSPLMPYFAQLDRTIAKYPYDPRRSEQLMNEAGYSRGGDGMFASATGERFKPDFWVTAGSQYERHQAIITEGWKRAGIDAEPWAIPLALGRQNEVRATFPGLTQIGGGSTEDSVMKNFISSQIGSAGNAWRGSNRGGWSSAEIDRLWDTYGVTLEPAERTNLIIGMSKLMSEEIPGYPLYANINVRAQAAALAANLDEVVITTPSWNVHEWEFR